MCCGRKKGKVFLLQKFSVVYPAAPLTFLLGLTTTTTDFGHSSQTLASKLELTFFRKHGFFSLWSRDLMLVPTTQIWYQTFCHCDDMKQTGCTFNKHQKGCLLRNFWGYSLTIATSSRVFSLQPSRNHLRQILNLKLQIKLFLGTSATLPWSTRFWSEIKHISSSLGLLQTNNLTV